MRTAMIAAGLLLAPTAFGQEAPPPPAEATTTTPEPAPAARPKIRLPNPADETRTFAGLGSGIAYGDLGVSEVGGSLALSTSNGVMTFSTDPTIGYFVVDNVELSGSFGLRHVSVEGENSNQFSLIGEPSLHLPINEQLYWFAGLGLGIALVDTSQSTYDLGLAFAPRGGVQILLGRSGLLNLGLRYSAVLSDVDRASSEGGRGTVLAVVPSFDLQAGYTVMF